ncbi:MAG TPA: hypothetical protein VHI13_13780 [Candidatus Kapabacteria bacterium]|nr:hypothetical protein [Candidatus Kapabacteria bacterium]
MTVVIAAIVAVMFLCRPAHATAQPKGKSAVDKETRSILHRRLEELFSLCDEGKFSRAAGYLVYRGSNKARKWHDTYLYANPDEGRQVDDICGRIARMLKECSGYGIVSFKRAKQSEGEWVVATVTFTTQKGAVSRQFAFLWVKENYSLGDID